MQYDILEKYITDFIKEQQLKIGYRKETIRIYYFLSSLNRYIKEQFSINEMLFFLNGFCKEVSDRLGDIAITHSGERFCLVIPEKGTEYVHQLPLHNQFLSELLQTVSSHAATMDNIISLFQKYPYELCIKPITDGEFDLLIYYRNHPDDNYRYCFKDEGVHITYHRFTPEDYEDMF